MSVGAAVTKAEVDNGAAACARQIFSAVKNIGEFKLWLDTMAVSDLVTLGYTTNEGNVLKSAFSDLADIAGIFQGSAAVNTLPHDYRTFSKQLLGVGLY